jgi:predicted enzyme related to lactoylglutathione lyase
MSGNTEICQIPAGETECTGAVSWSIPKSGNGITTYFFRLTDMDKTLSSVTVEKDITGTLICYPR